MNQELKEVIIALVMELDGAGLIITDQDAIEEELENISQFIESNLEVKNEN
jgi:hypothetical protein